MTKTAPAPIHRPALRIDRETAMRFAEKIAAGASVRALARETGFCRRAIARALVRIAAPERDENGRRRGSALGGEAVAAAAAMRRGVTGEAGSAEWFAMNALALRAAVRAKRRGAEGGPHGASGESAKRGSTSTAECAAMLLNPSRILADLGIEIADSRLRDEALFALGQESAADRIRRILTAPIAKSRPFSALRLALESEMPPGEVLAMLSELPPERASDSGDDAGDPDGESAAQSETSRGVSGVPPPAISGTGGRQK